MIPKEYWIEKLGLIPHPEGGYYKELPASSTWLADKGRPLYTNIYFLLTADSPSHLHALTADEVWYFHYGSSLQVHEISPDGAYQKTTVGLDLAAGDVLQYTVNHGNIFGSSVAAGDDYALVSCMVAPGFTFADFKLFSQAELHAQFPQHTALINELAVESVE